VPEAHRAQGSEVRLPKAGRTGLILGESSNGLP